MLTIPEVTDAGWNLLTQRGLNVKRERLTHGGFAHEVAAHALRRLARQKGCKVDFEFDLGPVRVDARWQDRNGKTVFFQIGVHDPAREADALVRAWSVPVVRDGKLVLITRDKAFADRTFVLVKQADPKSDVIKAIERRLVGQLVTAAG